MFLRGLKERVGRELLEQSLLQRFEQEIEPLDLLQFLKLQPERWKFYWSSRTGDYEYAAYSKLTHYQGSTKRPFQSFPSYAFCPFDQKDPVFVLPRFEITRRGKHFCFACHFRGCEKRKVGAIFSELVQDLREEKELPLAVPCESKLMPSIEGWKRRIEKAHQLFKKSELEKIVLARQMLLRFEETLNPFDLLRHLQKKTPACFHFLFSRQKACAFLGASPELLFERKGSRIKSEAVAGTRPVGKAFAKELLASAKDLKEHHFVVKHLQRNFQRLCRSWADSGGISILEKKHWQHLFYQIHGDLRPGFCDGGIFSILHPTPAVGAYPFSSCPFKASPISKVREIEGFDRGLYAGALGWRSSDIAEFAVAIRSAYVFPKSLLLYSGAGIIEESNVFEEWNEINLKISNFLELFTSS